MKSRFWGTLGLVASLLLLGGAAWIIHQELRTYHYHDVLREFRQLPLSRLLGALALTALSYMSLTGYDFLAFRYIRKTLAYPRIAMTSFISYVFSYNVGLSFFGGTAIRYRLYSAWGLSAIEVAQIATFCMMTLWLGGLTLTGTVLLCEPGALHRIWSVPGIVWRFAGAGLLLGVASYLAFGPARGKILRLRQWSFSLPSLPLSIGQIALSCADWMIAASVLYVLIPGLPLSFRAFLGIFLLAQLAGVVSHVPGGLGIFETAIIYFLAPVMNVTIVAGSLMAYRAIYYFGPLVLASVLMGSLEAWRKRGHVQVATAFFDRRISGFIPQMFSILIFVAGAILLFSGSTPIVHGRLVWLEHILPLPVIEVSHFLASVIGGLLLVLAWGLYHRLDAAYVLTNTFLASGIALCLLKGVAYEEALVLLVMMAALIPCHRHFYRRTSLLEERFTEEWIIAVIGVLGSAIWLGLFSFKHVEYSSALWWRFEFLQDAPRFLRAMVGALAALLFFGAAHLLRPSKPQPDEASPEVLDRVRQLVEASPSTASHLALLGDKHFLFSDSKRSFLMYGIQGRSWVAMGDPVGPIDEIPDLLWKFREDCDAHRGWPVFYAIGRDNLYLYMDLGLTAYKLGEEALIPLTDFSLEGGDRRGLRYTHNKLSKEGVGFRIIQPPQQDPLLQELRQISDAWLIHKNTREKGFSLGFFDEEYLRQSPIALLEKDGRILAFANVWSAANKKELSVDLMRYGPDAPASAMEYLFIQLMLWGKEEGYASFNLGMAPFSGFEAHALAPLWMKFGAFLFRHGEHFYNFQGLREYKEKFGPAWEPRYMSCPRGLALPAVLANIASLISGGLKGVVSR